MRRGGIDGGGVLSRRLLCRGTTRKRVLLLTRSPRRVSRPGLLRTSCNLQVRGLSVFSTCTLHCLSIPPSRHQNPHSIVCNHPSRVAFPPSAHRRSAGTNQGQVTVVAGSMNAPPVQIVSTCTCALSSTPRKSPSASKVQPEMVTLPEGRQSSTQMAGCSW